MGVLDPRAWEEPLQLPPHHTEGSTAKLHQEAIYQDSLQSLPTPTRGKKHLQQDAAKMPLRIDDITTVPVDVEVMMLSPSGSLTLSQSTPRDSEFGLSDWQLGMDAMLDAQGARKAKVDAQQVAELQAELQFWKERVGDVLCAAKMDTKAARRSLVFAWRVFRAWQQQAAPASGGAQDNLPA
jgi:hypothetical protein